MLILSKRALRLSLNTSLLTRQRRLSIPIIASIKAQHFAKSHLHPLWVGIGGPLAMINDGPDSTTNQYIPPHPGIGTGNRLGGCSGVVPFQTLNYQIGRRTPHHHIAGTFQPERTVFIEQFAIGIPDFAAVGHPRFNPNRLDRITGNRGTPGSQQQSKYRQQTFCKIHKITAKKMRDFPLT